MPEQYQIQCQNFQYCNFSLQKQKTSRNKVNIHVMHLVSINVFTIIKAQLCSFLSCNHSTSLQNVKPMSLPWAWTSVTLYISQLSMQSDISLMSFPPQIINIHQQLSVLVYFPLQTTIIYIITPTVTPVYRLNSALSEKFLYLSLHINVELADSLKGQFLLLDQDLNRITHEILCDLQNLSWHGG